MIGVKANTYAHTQSWLEDNYTKTEVMIPMRDGVRLYTAIYSPRDTSQPHPVIMMRTPYAIRPYGMGYGKDLRRSMSVYADHGYIYVIQNVRGTYLSEGEFVNVRPKVEDASASNEGALPKVEDAGASNEAVLRKGNAEPSELNLCDEATDTFDTAEWIIRNLPTNGNIGVKGTSYPGFYATYAALSNNPAIKAVSPQAPVADWFMGDDAHRNGAFMLADMYGFGGSFFRHRKAPTTRGLSPVITPDTTLYEYFRGRDMASLMAPFGDSLQMFSDMRAHPTYDSFWLQRNPTTYFKDIKPAVMVVGGTFDAEDCYGAFATWRSVAEKSTGTELYFVLGPWAHGSWKDFSYDHLDGAYFGSGTAKQFIENIEYPFFAYYLEGKGNKPSYKVALLRSGDTREDTPKPQWEFLDKWPDAAHAIRLYPRRDGSLKGSVPKGESTRTYISDPANPVPYYSKDGEQRIRDYMAADQRFLRRRKDVLSFVGRPLEQDVLLDGPVRVSLKVSSTGTDADFIVKLIDIRPDGYQMLLRWDVMPARFRNGFSKADAITPGEPFTLGFTMCDVAHLLCKGHRLMVQIQSSCFPLVAMNPQSFVTNPFDAVAEDYRSAEMTVYLGPETFVELGIEPLKR